jgi:hypothetical protein
MVKTQKIRKGTSKNKLGNLWVVAARINIMCLKVVLEIEPKSLEYKVKVKRFIGLREVVVGAFGTASVGR